MTNPLVIIALNNSPFTRLCINIRREGSEIQESHLVLSKFDIDSIDLFFLNSETHFAFVCHCLQTFMKHLWLSSQHIPDLFFFNVHTTLTPVLLSDV